MTGMADAAFDLAKDPVAAKADALARHAVGRFGAPKTSQIPRCGCYPMKHLLFQGRHLQSMAV